MVPLGLSSCPTALPLLIVVSALVMPRMAAESLPAVVPLSPPHCPLRSGRDLAATVVETVTAPAAYAVVAVTAVVVAPLLLLLLLLRLVCPCTTNNTASVRNHFGSGFSLGEGPMLGRRAHAEALIRGPSLPAWAVLALELGRLLSPTAAPDCGRAPAPPAPAPRPTPRPAPLDTCEAVRNLSLSVVSDSSGSASGRSG